MRKQIVSIDFVGKSNCDLIAHPDHRQSLDFVNEQMKCNANPTEYTINTLGCGLGMRQHFNTFRMCFSVEQYLQQNHIASWIANNTSCSNTG